MYYRNGVRAEFTDLIGKTITSIGGLKAGSGDVKIVCSDGSMYRQLHEQECCENVNINDVIGDVEDLLNSPILKAEEVSSDKNPIDYPASEWQDSFTWTFYHLATIKGYVTIRWYGESNGYYSESVDFYHTNGKEE